jgi:hypothetical protein
MDVEVLQATADRSSFPVCVIAETEAMGKLLSTFHSSLSEVTIIAHPDGGGTVSSVGKSVQLRSFLDPNKSELTGGVTRPARKHHAAPTMDV